MIRQAQVSQSVTEKVAANEFGGDEGSKALNVSRNNCSPYTYRDPSWQGINKVLYDGLA